MKNKQPNIIQVNNFPQIHSCYIKRVLVGIRPFRKGGIRLQLEQISNKNIIYNYGHGGAGVSLAPACGIEAAQLAFKAVDSSKQVSVLGSGIVGLFTALECANRGLKVTIYTDRIPKKNEKNVLNMCTSQIAPGYWLPCNYQFSNIQQHKRRTQISFKKYNQWSKKSQNIYQIECYQQMDIELFKQSSPDFIYNTSKNAIIKIGNKQFDVIHFKTLQINLQKFLQDLIHECIEKGIKFQTRKFNNLDDILSIRDNVIVACLGLNSKFVFNDDKVYGVKGHLIQMQNTSKQPAVYGFNFQGLCDMYCFKDKILIGLSSENSDQLTINEETVKQLQNRAYNFYKYVGLNTKPKL